MFQIDMKIKNTTKKKLGVFSSKEIAEKYISIVGDPKRLVPIYKIKLGSDYLDYLKRDLSFLKFISFSDEEVKNVATKYKVGFIDLDQYNQLLEKVRNSRHNSSFSFSHKLSVKKTMEQNNLNDLDKSFCKKLLKQIDVKNYISLNISSTDIITV